MLDWITNPYGISNVWAGIFIIGTLFALVFGFVGGMMAVWRNREKRDGRR